MGTESTSAGCSFGLTTSSLQKEWKARYPVLLTFLKHLILQQFFSLHIAWWAEEEKKSLPAVSPNLVIFSDLLWSCFHLLSERLLTNTQLKFLHGLSFSGEKRIETHWKLSNFALRCHSVLDTLRRPQREVACVLPVLSETELILMKITNEDLGAGRRSRRSKNLAQQNFYRTSGKC